MKKLSLPLRLVSGLLYLFLYAPIVVVMIYSFNSARFGVGWRGFTVQWYAALLENSQALSAAKNTLVLALFSTGFSTALGTLLGYGLSRYRFPGKHLAQRLLYIPVFVPDIVMAVSLLLFYSLLRRWLAMFEPGMLTMVLGHVTFQLPFVALVVRSRLHDLDPALEEAAHELKKRGHGSDGGVGRGAGRRALDMETGLVVGIVGPVERDRSASSGARETAGSIDHVRIGGDADPHGCRGSSALIVGHGQHGRVVSDILIGVRRSHAAADASIAERPRVRRDGPVRIA